MLRFATILFASLLITACDKGPADPAPDAKKDAPAASGATGTTANPPPAPAPKDSWIEVANAEGRLKVKFPVAPQKSVDKAPTPLGDIAYTTLGAEKSDAYFAVSYSDYPEAAMEGFDVNGGLDGARDGAINGMGGVLIKEEQITYQGFPAREFEAKATAEGMEIHVKARIVLGLPRLWQQLVVYPAAKPPQDMDKFFDSLEVKGDPNKPAPAGGDAPAGGGEAPAK